MDRFNSTMVSEFRTERVTPYTAYCNELYRVIELNDSDWTSTRNTQWWYVLPNKYLELLKNES